MLTKTIKNRRFGSNTKACSSYELHRKLKDLSFEIAYIFIAQPLLRHEVVLYNCFTDGYGLLIKPAVPSAVSYQSIGCMVKPLPGEASGKQYQSLAREAINGAKNREGFSLWGLNTN